MDIGSQEPDRLTLRLTRGEICQWNNALNEVCNGFSVANFQAAIGISENAAETLLEKVHSLTPDEPAVFLLEDVLAIRNALTAVLTELDSAEFHTRTGSTVEDARKMRNALDELTGQMRFVKTA